ncbi:AAA domain-containing protein [Streptoalloteichus tenebrarius]|uniref:AAA domain-containing protein n=1 Tax=Streptoalloteichus tenebrarius (strain ATCC 17920 / DSM 40477 / JCM 4838 / CBS 697.72 / NBRC 16177 / NCIMB 11028 / NRRL B-12390 / A12253. 1 / ISP 5477) TaxID=1933 RepID=A0ABT1I3Q3_STRSD|nr:AAA family ATPase [Streptoalloteichus tenebrarius]MCP2262416.1 AAA domain-containing protein [Streptoalloteichus tenebrarius]BFF03368.1 AAA family ATPase [Streptoalloteichus tenebrarius]
MSPVASSAHRPAAQGPPLTLLVGRRDLLVVAGLPGAGKSTLLNRLRPGGRHDVHVLDSDQVRGALRAAFPDALPYAWYRPLVHLLHRLRIAAYALVGSGPLVVHEPATRASTRLGLALLGALTRRPRRLLWLDVDPWEAMAGQRERGRVIPARSFDRHVRRAVRLRRALRDGRPPLGWSVATVLTRGQAAGGLHLAVTSR